MVILFTVALLLVILLVYDYTSGLTLDVTAIIASQGADIRILRSFINISVYMEKSEPMVEASVWGFHVLRKRVMLNRRKTRSTNVVRIMRALQFRQFTAEGSYSLENPFQTGIVYAALNALVMVCPIGQILLLPDFTADDAYAEINAHTKFSFSHTIFNYMTRRTTSWSRI